MHGTWTLIFNNPPGYARPTKGAVMFSTSDFARVERPDFNPREAGQRYGAIIENLKAEV